MTSCQGPVVAVENGSLVLQARVGALFRIQTGGSFHGPAARAAKVTDDTGRFDDESR